MPCSRSACWGNAAANSRQPSKIARCSVRDDAAALLVLDKCVSSASQLTLFSRIEGAVLSFC